MARAHDLRALLALLLIASAVACTNRFADLSSEADGPALADGGAEDVTPRDAAPPCADRPGLLALLPPSRGAARHVDPSGDDRAAGTAGQPWKTPQKAVDSLAPGETAFVHAGVYAAPVSWTRSGTADAPITLAGDPGAPAIFTDTFQLRGRFLRVTGLVFDGALRAGTTFPLLAVRAADVEISNNEFRGAKRVGVEGFLEDRASPDRVRIVGNWFHDGVQAIAWHAGAGSLIASNLIHDHTDIGILLDPAPRGTLVLGNTIVRGRIGIVVGLAASSTAAGTKIVNNVVSGHDAQGITGTATASDNEARRNLFFRNSAPITGSVTNTDNVSGSDPLFVASRDLHVRAGSPALGAADLDFTPVIDRDGRCRPIGAPDLGAFEQ